MNFNLVIKANDGNKTNNIQSPERCLSHISSDEIDSLLSIYEITFKLLCDDNGNKTASK